MKCQTLGLPELTAAKISDIETGRVDPDGRWRRSLSVDELVVLATALEVDAAYLLNADSCTVCGGAPVAGFSCNECGAPCSL